MFSAAVVAVALKLVVESSATETVTPASSSAALTPAIGEPEQSALAKRWTVAPETAVPTSFGLLSLAGEAGIVALSCGAWGEAVSTVQVKFAGVASVLPALSIARTSKLWEPSLRPLSSRGEEHGAKAPASSLHSNEATPEPPASAPEKVKVAVATLTSAEGWVSIWVSERWRRPTS